MRQANKGRYQHDEREENFSVMLPGMRLGDLREGRSSPMSNPRQDMFGSVQNDVNLSCYCAVKSANLKCNRCHCVTQLKLMYFVSHICCTWSLMMVSRLSRQSNFTVVSLFG